MLGRLEDIKGKLNFVTKNRFAYELLKKYIMSGELKPSERLIISKLAKSLEISVIPVREAITKLSTEGLGVQTAHVGAVVSPINYDDLKENYIIRTELEGLATEHAVEHLTDRDFTKLRKNIDQMRKAIMAKEFSKIGVINKEFHQIIYQACPYKKLNKMILDLWNNIDRVQSIFALVPNRATASLKEHIDILDAL
jgi:DNA-binding GntR family transcriptional regulator